MWRELDIHQSCFQADLKTSSSQREESDTKATHLAKQITTIESQLQDETGQKLALQLRLQQEEAKVEGLQDQIREFKDSKKAMETKNNQLTAQVRG